MAKRTEPSKVKFNRYMLSFENRISNTYQRVSPKQTIDLIWDIFRGAWGK